MGCNIVFEPTDWTGMQVCVMSLSKYNFYVNYPFKIFSECASKAKDNLSNPKRKISYNISFKKSTTLKVVL